MPGRTRVTRPLWMLPAKEYSFSRSWKISTSWSSSRIATRVSCRVDETTSSFDIAFSRSGPYESSGEARQTSRTDVLLSCVEATPPEYRADLPPHNSRWPEDGTVFQQCKINIRIGQSGNPSFGMRPSAPGRRAFRASLQLWFPTQLLSHYALNELPEADSCRSLQFAQSKQLSSQIFLRVHY